MGCLSETQRPVGCLHHRWRPPPRTAASTGCAATRPTSASSALRTTARSLPRQLGTRTPWLAVAPRSRWVEEGAGAGRRPALIRVLQRLLAVAVCTVVLPAPPHQRTHLGRSRLLQCDALRQHRRRARPPPPRPLRQRPRLSRRPRSGWKLESALLCAVRPHAPARWLHPRAPAYCMQVAHSRARSPAAPTRVFFCHTVHTSRPRRLDHHAPLRAVAWREPAAHPRHRRRVLPLPRGQCARQPRLCTGALALHDARAAKDDRALCTCTSPSRTLGPAVILL